MAVRAIRGATTVERNTREDVLGAVMEMMSAIIVENRIVPEDISDIIFAVTPDITAVFPASAVRRMGITDVPLLDTAAPDIDGALAMCIRVMVHINTDKSNSELKHVYLNGAETLRPDIAEKSAAGKISVAIDGPAGAGKSSVAKAAARRLGYAYIDTGAMYRAVAVYAIDNDIDISDTARFLDRINIGVVNNGSGQRIFLNGVDVTERIRENDASMGASAVAAIPQVREKLVTMQRAMARRGGVIVDGRDIGSVVLPDAELKIFLTASVDERARRRHKQNLEKGIESDFETVRQDVEKRDYNDSHRAVSPLRQVEDAILTDTTDMEFENSVNLIVGMIERAEAKAKGEDKT